MASPSLSPARGPGLAPSVGTLAIRPGNLLTRLFAGLVDWNDRYRQRVHLAQMDDRMLRDLGLTRSQALGEHDKPFWRG
ncbi:uncharacterized protein YjiS (DUF1127 family) [Stella humosa]|uniref:Uncharacterized protein YjiS (DUF1127 family) n=1 Tax=Stella humosa TaxID=94 RepID=A0A3N1LI51_9PROT|nr:DUF1127 domain-containing protein [Stella humosa]ROP90508.1 uncharacterized protein YjiS (DUF1127 family) [Stella humosa]BBK29599.1 hypothetical protein STHU_02330 [Stella humosa]